MLSKTPRTEVKKGTHKVSTDTQHLYQIIDEALVGHIGITAEHGPVVIPLLVWRIDDNIYVHGAKNSRLLKQLKQGGSTCVTFTLFDGWVLTRSAFSHSAHYRSAVVYGSFDVVEDAATKNACLNHFIEQIAPTRTHEVRHGNERELAATELLVMPLTEASVKISRGEAKDENKDDMQRNVWAGILPYKTVVGPLIPGDEAAAAMQAPDYSAAYGERWFE